MPALSPAAVAAARAAVESAWREHSRHALATLVRLLGDFDLAEEALHDAFRAALEQWPAQGVPGNPYSWLVSAGRFKAIDQIRRRRRYDLDDGRIAERVAAADGDPAEVEIDAVGDDRLRLVFTCCHPVLAPEARVALTLREVCGLATEEIARAFLVPVPTLAQRIVRAKAKLRQARVGYQVPGRAELPARLASVLQVVYLVFNEGHSASAGAQAVRHDLVEEAIRLGRLLVALLPEPEAVGLLALMLLHASRRHARTGADGALVLLPDQDRGRWDRALIDEGLALVRLALRARPPGSYALQAAIAAVHAEAATAAATDWPQIVALYDLLLRVEPSPVVALNRAVAIAERDGAAAGLALVDALLAEGVLAGYHLAHASRAELLRRLGRTDEARHAYQRALGLVRQLPERAFLSERLAALP
ncbi:MAG: RNA polymerase sigma factor [Pseudoxanthomonas sp.]|nr:RNA polymerase sigma factor [Pseudoxanthomonas sp.]